MRVIAGIAKGRTLKTPASITRPTMDRVRAAIFSMLGDRVSNARVLDLFAGTGAMGIEALSRGAESAIFIDQDKKSTEVIRQNLLLTKLSGEIKQVDAISFLKYQKESFDLVFADPPYTVKSLFPKLPDAANNGVVSAFPSSSKNDTHERYAPPTSSSPGSATLKKGSNNVSDWIAKLLSTPELLEAIAEEGLLIVECEKTQLLPEIPGLEQIVNRTYGITRIVIFCKKSSS